MSGVIWVVCTISVVARKIYIRYVSEMSFKYEYNNYSFFLKGAEEFITVIFKAIIK
jgi:hypothetical protein